MLSNPALIPKPINFWSWVTEALVWECEQHEGQCASVIYQAKFPKAKHHQHYLPDPSMQGLWCHVSRMWGGRKVFMLPTAHCRDDRQKSCVPAQEVTTTWSWVPIPLFVSVHVIQKKKKCHIGHCQIHNKHSVDTCDDESSSQQICWVPTICQMLFSELRYWSTRNRQSPCPCRTYSLW